MELDENLLNRARLLVENDRLFLRSLISRRESLGYSQAQVAELLGITQPSVAAFERYDSDPKLSTIRKYALAVEANVDHLLVPSNEEVWTISLLGEPESNENKGFQRETENAENDSTGPAENSFKVMEDA